jgi:hypothetical protein
MKNPYLCDRCTARALSRFLMPDAGLDLQFCNHHAAKFSESLSAQGFAVDESFLREKECESV